MGTHISELSPVRQRTRLSERRPFGSFPEFLSFTAVLSHQRISARIIMFGRETTIALGLAAVLHAAAFGGMWVAKGAWSIPRAAASIRLALNAAPEQAERPFITSVSALPSPPPPQPPPPLPDESPPKADQADQQQMLADLEAERQKLEQELKLQKRTAADAFDKKLNTSRQESGSEVQVAAGPPGTVRELDFGGWSQDAVDRVMARYGLRITRKATSGGSNQSFLSSAATSEGSRYYSDRRSLPGVYDVFQLSKEAVAQMSRLEEQEIQTRQLNMERTQVKHVRFGIVQRSDGEYDIGVLDFQAQTIP